MTSENQQNSPLPPRFSRPSYANVARGVTAAHHFNTLAAAGGSYPSTAASSISQQQAQPQRQEDPIARHRSRSSLRSIDMEGFGGGGGVGSGGGVKRPASSWDDAGGSEGRMGCTQHEEHPPFVMPSYLKHSRYVEKLQMQWEEHLAELREHYQQFKPPSRRPSLSTSGSSVNLSKMQVQHVHRAPVQDVIERLPPPAPEDAIKLLPTRWSDEDRMSGLEILAEGSEVRFNGVTKTTEEAASVRSDYPMPKEVGIYYYEVTILSKWKEGLIGVGFSGRKVNLNRLPGWEAESWAYHGDDGYSFACTASGKGYGPRFATQDVVGCGINFRKQEAFFTKNGVYLGVAFKDIKADRLYPSVGIKKPGEHLRVNFGRHPFAFSIDRMMEEERSLIRRDTQKADLSSLHPPDDEKALIHNLIGQYLAHQGYVETARAFSLDVWEQKQSLSSDTQHQLPPISSDDDIHASNRQKIRKAILDGEIDHALKYMNTFYPHVLAEERNKDIDFRLKCRKFIELMRKCYEQPAANLSPTTVTKSVASLESNGHLSDHEDGAEPTDTQMELDDQLQRETSKSLDPPNNDDIDMDASNDDFPPKASFMKHQELLNQVYAYGAELRAAYIGDTRPQVQKQLSDIFAMMAYQDPGESVVGSLLDVRGRAGIAEEVNGAILVSLGKPASAALEKLCTTTEALLELAAGRNGGTAAAFVNVRADFLQP